MSEYLSSRRELLKTGLASAAAGVALWSLPEFVFASQDADEELVPFQNVPRSTPNSLDWETLTEWLTPQDQVFSVQHYGIPVVDAAKYELEISGLVERPRKLTLDAIKALPKRDQHMTL